MPLSQLKLAKGPRNHPRKFPCCRSPNTGSCQNPYGILRTFWVERVTLILDSLSPKYAVKDLLHLKLTLRRKLFALQVGGGELYFVQRPRGWLVAAVLVHVSAGFYFFAVRKTTDPRCTEGAQTRSRYFIVFLY